MRRPDAAPSPAASTSSPAARPVRRGARGLASGASQLADGVDAGSPTGATVARRRRAVARGRHGDAGGRPGPGIHRRALLLRRRRDEPRRRSSPTRSTTDGVGSSLFGASAVPLLATLALWFGGLGTFVALQAASRRALTSRAPSALLALRGLAPAAALGAVQGLLVAGVVQLAASYDWAAVVAVRGAVRRSRGRRVRRGQPGARRRLRRRRALARRARRRARGRDRRGLDGAGRAVGCGVAPADRSRLQRHASLRRPASAPASRLLIWRAGFIATIAWPAASRSRGIARRRRVTGERLPTAWLRSASAARTPPRLQRPAQIALRRRRP